KYILPEPHYLEAWGDCEAKSGVAGLYQPTVHRLGDTRSLIETIATWTGKPASAYDLLRQSWKSNVFPRQSKEPDFEKFWERTLQNGFAEIEPFMNKVKSFNPQTVRTIAHAERPAADSFALALYPTVSMLDGRNAYNPWLHELPDPITKVTWDNCACFAPATAKRLAITDGAMVWSEATDGTTVELPACVQPRHDESTVAVALGYGSRLRSRFANVGPEWIDALLSVGHNGLVAVNAAAFLGFRDGALHSSSM